MVEQAERKKSSGKTFAGINYPRIIGRIEQWVLKDINEGVFEADERTLTLGNQALEYLRVHGRSLDDIASVTVWERKPNITGFSTQELHPEKSPRMPNYYPFHL